MSDLLAIGQKYDLSSTNMHLYLDNIDTNDDNLIQVNELVEWVKVNLAVSKLLPVRGASECPNQWVNIVFRYLVGLYCLLIGLFYGGKYCAHKK